MTDTPVVLFLCTHNAGRSLAARVLLDHYAQGRVEVLSAGSEPADQLNPSVVAILSERGLDPAREFPKPLTDETAQAARVAKAVGAEHHVVEMTSAESGPSSTTSTAESDPYSPTSPSL